MSQPSHSARPAEFTPNLIQPAGYLCYINGRRVPVMSIVVTYGVADIPAASIELFPSKHLQRLGAEDTVEVQIFYLDTFYEEVPKYRLLFDGVIVAWSYTSTPHGRAITFDATMDITRYHQARMDFLTTTEGTAAALASAGASPNAVPFAGLFHPYALLKRGLAFSENELSNNAAPRVTISRPFEFLWNTAMSLCSTDVPPRVASIPVVNYFARWVRRRNFVNRLVAFPVFDDQVNVAGDGVFPIIKAVQSQELLAQIGAAVSSEVGQGGSLMDVLMRLLGSVYCELVMLPTAPAVRVNLDGVVQGPLGDEKADPTQPVRIANYFVKPQSLFGMVPTFNVLFPSQITSIAYREDYSTQPTRIYAYDTFAMTITGAGSNAAARETLGVAYPPQAEAAMHARAAIQGDPGSAATKSAIATGKNVLVWPEEFFRGPVPSHMQTPYVLGLLQIMQQKTAQAEADAGKDPEAALSSAREKILGLSRLYAQYEYYRQRYANRGGAADLTFNPYVVPGFPCVIFDHRGSGYDQVGYVNNVQHSLTKGKMSTAINYSHGRTLREYSYDLKKDAEELQRKLGSSPREVIDSVRQNFQDPAKAQEIYQRMFYAGQGVVAAVNPLDLVQYGDGVGPEVTGSTESEVPLRTIGTAEQAASGATPATTTIRDDAEFFPKDGYEELFAGHDKAMNFVARPICTLEEYVRFIHGDSAPASDEVMGRTEKIIRPGVSIVTYEKIFKRAPHTGPAPTSAEVGVATQPTPGIVVPYATVSTGNSRVTTVSYKATTKDWEAALQLYIDEIEGSQFLVE